MTLRRAKVTVSKNLAKAKIKNTAPHSENGCGAVFINSYYLF